MDGLKFYDFDSQFSARKTYYSKLGGSGTYTSSYDQNVWLLKQFRSIMGYSQGGFVAGLNNIIKRNGDDGLATLKVGEAVLPPELAQDWKSLISSLPTLNKVIEGSATNNDIDMQVILPNVTNYEQFFTELCKDPRFSKIVLADVNSAMTGKNSLAKNRFR